MRRFLSMLFGRSNIPPLPDEFADDAARMPAALRALLVDVPCRLDVDEVALASSIGPVNAHRFAASTSADVMHARGVVSSAGCAALRRCLDEATSTAKDSIDARAAHQRNISSAELETLVGAQTARALWALPARYYRHAAAPEAAEKANARRGQVEMFLRRYSCRERPFLMFHADKAALTINVALSSHQRRDGGHLLGLYDGGAHVIRRQLGDATVHTSSLLHGVSRVASVRVRYALIIFFRSHAEADGGAPATAFSSDAERVFDIVRLVHQFGYV
jgi:predicted 2-oxoglutarate/Fe(II)-dependent dioxygenase YbiX